jgi:hypothetical protein
MSLDRFLAESLTKPNGRDAPRAIPVGEFVALASDRRITWQIGGASARWEDTENKAIVLGGHSLMGYTGFARLAQVKTEQWVVERLTGVDPSACFLVLARETESAVNALGLPLKRSGHAFAAVGYTAVREDTSGKRGKPNPNPRCAGQAGLSVSSRS